MPRNNNSSFPSVLTGRVQSASIHIPGILVTIGSRVLAGGSLNQLTWHLNISFMSGSQNKNHDCFLVGFFFIFRPNYFVFRLSQSRAWCCQVSVWCFLSFCSTLRYLFECSVVPCALCWVAALISYECTKHLTSRYWKIVSRQIPGFCNKLRRFFRMIQHQNVFCLWHWNCSCS